MCVVHKRNSFKNHCPILCCVLKWHHGGKEIDALLLKKRYSSAITKKRHRINISWITVIHLWMRSEWYICWLREVREDNSNSCDKNTSLSLPCQRRGVQTQYASVKQILCLSATFLVLLLLLLTDGKPKPSTEMGCSIPSDRGCGFHNSISTPFSMICRSLPHAAANQFLSDQTNAGAWCPQYNHVV